MWRKVERGSDGMTSAVLLTPGSALSRSPPPSVLGSRTTTRRRPKQPNERPGPQHLQGLCCDCHAQRRARTPHRTGARTKPRAHEDHEPPPTARHATSRTQRGSQPARLRSLARARRPKERQRSRRRPCTADRPASSAGRDPRSRPHRRRRHRAGPRRPAETPSSQAHLPAGVSGRPGRRQRPPGPRRPTPPPAATSRRRRLPGPHRPADSAPAPGPMGRPTRPRPPAPSAGRRGTGSPACIDQPTVALRPASTTGRSVPARTSYSLRGEACARPEARTGRRHRTRTATTRDTPVRNG